MKSLGKYKVDVAKERILSINPRCSVITHCCFYLPQNSSLFNFEDYDYVIDAVDTVTAKINLVLQANEKNIKIISSMGAGNKLDPTGFMVSDIYKTSICPLAKVMRRELKKRGIKKLKVVYSKEAPLKPIKDDDISCSSHFCPLDTEININNKRETPGSVAFVPSVAGLIIAGEVIKDLIRSDL